MNHHHTPPTNFPVSKGAYAKIPKLYRRSSPRIANDSLLNYALLLSFHRSHLEIYKKALKRPQVYAPLNLLLRARIILGVLWDRRWPDSDLAGSDLISKAPPLIPEHSPDSVTKSILTTLRTYSVSLEKGEGICDEN